MEDIQPSTLLARQSIGQPRKLRDSCFSCASSKVKCNKEKPTCIRCARRGLVCGYMASRRTGRTSVLGGKRPAARTADSDTATRPNNPNTSRPQEFQSSSRSPPLVLTPPDTACPSSDHHVYLGQDVWRTIHSPGASAGETALSPLTPNATNFDDLFASVFSSPMLETSDFESPPQHPTRSHAPPPVGTLSGLSFSKQDLFPSQDLAAGELLGFDPSSSEPRRCCLTVAVEILTQLFPNAPTACTLSGSQVGTRKVPTTESVISENKQNIGAISSMLDCPCSQDEYLLAIISLIVFKLMAWYAAAAGDKSLMDNGVSKSNSLVAHPERPSPSAFGEHVLHLPTTIGDYCVDGHDRSRMAAQLVLSELHRVQRLVNLLSKRLESIRLRNGSLSSPSSASSCCADSGDALGIETRASSLSASTFDQLEADLRKRLRTVSSETIDILRRE